MFCSTGSIKISCKEWGEEWKVEELEAFRGLVWSASLCWKLCTNEGKGRRLRIAESTKDLPLGENDDDGEWFFVSKVSFFFAPGPRHPMPPSICILSLPLHFYTRVLFQVIPIRGLPLSVSLMCLNIIRNIVRRPAQLTSASLPASWQYHLVFYVCNWSAYILSVGCSWK